MVTKTRQNAILANPLLQATGYVYISAFCPHSPQINVTGNYLVSSREAKLVTVFKHSNRLLSSGVRYHSPTNLLCFPLCKPEGFTVVHQENNSVRLLLYHLTSERTTQRSANQTSKSQNKKERRKKGSKVTSI